MPEEQRTPYEILDEFEKRLADAAALRKTAETYGGDERALVMAIISIGEQLDAVLRAGAELLRIDAP